MNGSINGHKNIDNFFSKNIELNSKDKYEKTLSINACINGQKYVVKVSFQSFGLSGSIDQYDIIIHTLHEPHFQSINQKMVDFGCN